MNQRIKITELFAKFQLGKVKLGPSWANAEIALDTSDSDAAWELYVEMLTRVVTQPLPVDTGDEETALDSVYSLFPITREVLRRHGRRAINFTKIAVPVLNQVVRPFTAKWHGKRLAGDLADEDIRNEFRHELATLQDDLRNYNRMLAGIAGVEDLTELEDVPGERNDGEKAPTQRVRQLLPRPEPAGQREICSHDGRQHH